MGVHYTRQNTALYDTVLGEKVINTIFKVLIGLENKEGCSSPFNVLLEKQILENKTTMKSKKDN